MMNVFEMKFAKVFPMLIAKAERKGRTREEVYELTECRICGIRVEEIDDPKMRDMRVLDKLVDELAKGKPMEKILNL